MDLLEWKDKYYKNNEFIVLYGSSSGIGYEYMKLLAEAGINIIAISNEKARLDVQKIELAKHYEIKIESLYCDLTNTQEIQNIAQYLKTKKIVGAVINAGFGLKKLADPNVSILTKDFVSLSTTGPSMILQVVIPKLQIANKGLVISVNSAGAAVDMSLHRASRDFWKKLYLDLKTKNKSSDIYFQLVLRGSSLVSYKNERVLQSELKQSTKIAMGSINSLHKLIYSHKLFDRLIPFFSS